MIRLHKARIRQANRRSVMMIVGTAAVLLVGGVATFANGSGTGVGGDSCASAAAPRTTIALADMSDAPLPSQTGVLRQAVREEAEATPRHGRLTLFAINGGSAFEPREVISLCSPPHREDFSMLVRTPERAERRWRKGFGDPFEDAAIRIATAPGSAASPLIESITAATWQPYWSANQGHRRLVIVSDLFEHQPGGFSLYTGGAAAFARSTLAHQAAPDLSGVEVEIVTLRRPDLLARQAAVVEPFWVAWLTARGATSVRFSGEDRPRRADSALVQLLANPQPRPGR